MNLLLETLDPLARLILQALLNSLWQGLLIVALVWLLLRVIGQVSATTRHAVWLVSLLTIGLLPALALTFSQRPQPSSSAPAAIVSATPEKAIALSEWRKELTPLNSPVRYFAAPVVPRKEAVAIVPVATSAVMSAPIASDKTVAETSARLSEPPVVGQNWAALNGGFSGRLLSLPGQFVVRFLNGRAPFLLAAAWFLVCLLMCWRIARSYFFLSRLRRQLAIVSPDLGERMQRLAARFGIRRRVGLFTAGSVKMPMTIGWLHPLIVLPQDLLESLSTAECDSVIAHELAHIKRWDYATNFIQRIVQALFFFHPAVWFINKQLVIERELACDDWAVKLTGEPRRYASCLAKLVELLSESKPLAAATGILFGKHIISRRVEMILNRDRNATTSVSKPALIYAIGLAVLFVFAFSTLSPVIAVPLAQKPAKSKAQEPKPAQPRTPSIAPAVPALPAEAQVLTPEPDAFAPLPPIIAGSEVMEFHPPTALAPLPAQLVGEGLTSLQDWERTPPPAIAPLAPGVGIGGLLAPGWITPEPLAPGAVWGQAAQASSNKTPTIPENELLGLLSDIVKRDADANVRREALQGIYRMRTDAAINTLIQLYDAVTDVKLKSEILSYLMRRNGDNSKAIAKLVQIAKNEKNEELLGRALSQLAYVKGDEGADHLIQIYDGLQDVKLKQRVIRSLAYNKSKKAVDKLMSIAKNDADPVLRQSAIRSIYEIDSRLYLNFAEGNRQGLLHPTPTPNVFVAPRAVEIDRLNERIRELNENDRMRFEFDGKRFELNQPQLEDLLGRARRAQERARDLNEKMRLEFDGRVFEWNKQQLEQFQQRGREAQQRARELIQEMQERARESFQFHGQPTPSPAPRLYRNRNEQEPQPEQQPQPAAKPQREGGQRGVKPVTVTAATATR
jgi:beta-lactamase regulating signal transducer with metallopeptidase domain